jgi:hypothetical protein
MDAATPAAAPLHRVILSHIILKSGQCPAVRQLLPQHILYGFVGWAKCRRSSKSEGESVPTIFRLNGRNGGHGAKSAPLPTLRTGRTVTKNAAPVSRSGVGVVE